MVLKGLSKLPRLLFYDPNVISIALLDVGYMRRKEVRHSLTEKGIICFKIKRSKTIKNVLKIPLGP